MRPEQAEQHEEHAVENRFEMTRQRHAWILQRGNGKASEQADQKQDQAEPEEQSLHVGRLTACSLVLSCNDKYFVAA